MYLLNLLNVKRLCVCVCVCVCVTQFVILKRIGWCMYRAAAVSDIVFNLCLFYEW